jgi:DNA-binding response OmpR family regulator
MPGMDGFEVCRRMRAYRHLDKVPVIFLTARKTVEDVRACMAAGGDDFMVKPLDVEKLQARIRRWVATRLPTG